MNLGRVGLAAPRDVYGCTIINSSNSNVQVRIIYEQIKGDTDDDFRHDRSVEFQLAKGKETHIEEEEFDKGSYQIRHTIAAIEVTFLNSGQTQALRAPFDGVTSPKLDWLFVIDNTRIKSVQRHS